MTAGDVITGVIAAAICVWCVGRACRAVAEQPRRVADRLLETPGLVCAECQRTPVLVAGASCRGCQAWAATHGAGLHPGAGPVLVWRCGSCHVGRVTTQGAWCGVCSEAWEKAAN